MSSATPRHRAVREPARRRPSRRSLATAAIGGVVLTCGIVGAQAVSDRSAETATATPAGEPAVAPVPESTDDVSRSAERPALDVAEAAALFEEAAKDNAAAEKKAKEAAAAKKAIEDAREDPRSVAREMVAERGWSAAEFGCLDALWVGESGWDYRATNPSSGAYGIPQSLPATKMAAAGDDWETNPITQIRWGLDYIADAYGTPCSANAFKGGNGFY